MQSQALNFAVSSARQTFAALCCLALLACSDGRDGADGADGAPGPAIPGVTSEAKALNVNIDSVVIDGTPVVDFHVRNENDVLFVGLQASQVRFNLVKLMPAIGGEPSHWQNYINRIEAAGAVGPGTVDQVQATTESNGVFENFGDGHYRYTFATDVTAVSEPFPVTYEPTLTHRLAMQISGGTFAPSNPTYTWRPSDGATSDIDTRDIVRIESCNECHGELALHGGGRIDTAYCVTCHNPGSTDANSGNTLDFKVMVHKIHRGESLPSVEAGGEYAIWGFRNTKHDYSDVVLPQDIRNCTKCHDAADIETPQAENWALKPSSEACGSCHDDVNFETGENHGPTDLVADNTECTVCHSDGGFVGSVAESHTIPAKVASTRYAFKLLSVTDTAPGETPTVTFSVTDPTNEDAAYDLQADPSWAQLANRASRLAISIGWDTRDHYNAGSGSTPGLPISIDALTASSRNADGSYSVTSPVAIPASVTGSGVVAIDGHPAADFDGDGALSDRVPVPSQVLYFPITDAVATPRRQVVDIAKCNQCHDQLSLHGNNRTDNPQICAICHNPDATDIARRPADPATTPDGLAEQSIDFKRLIHAIHGSEQRETPFVVFGFGNSQHDFSHVGFPNDVARCEICHTAGTQTLPLGETVLASTIDSGADKAEPADDMNITATAAVCSSCHDSDLAQRHMEQNGASFMTPQSMVDNGSLIETCAVCHGPGRLADVEQVHAH